MLKHRLITAAVLIPLVIAGILLLPTTSLAIVTGLFVLLGSYEWAGLCGWQSYLSRTFYTLVMAIHLGASYYSLLYFINTIIMLLAIACVGWLITFYWVWSYQRGSDLLPTQPLLKSGLGFLILSPAWIALLSLHQSPHYGGEWVVFLLVLIWSADTGAYFFGKKWGKTKLASKVSPGKTYEGVGGALLAGGVVTLSYALFKNMSVILSLLFFMICLFTIFMSILGDLVESLFKRQMNVKDSGCILPGHGGVLDRIDSLTAAIPVFVLSLYSLGNLF